MGQFMKPINPATASKFGGPPANPVKSGMWQLKDSSVCLCDATVIQFCDLAADTFA